MARKPRPPTTATGAKPPSSPEAENGFKEALDQQIGPLVPQSQRGEVVDRVYTLLVREQFSGPMPHPRHLGEYDLIVPGAAERIIAMAEKAQNYNIAQGTKALQSEIDDRKLGMWLGFASLALLVVGAGFFGYLGNNVAAGLFLSTAALGAVGIFVHGRLAKKP